MGHDASTGTAGGLHTAVLDLVVLSAQEQAELLEASRRAENLAVFTQLRAIAAMWESFWPDDVQRRLDRRRRRRDTSQESLREGLVVTETACRLGMTEGSASRRVDAAVALLVEQRLPLAAEVAAQGRLDWSRLNLLVGKTRCLTTDQAQVVEAEVLTGAVLGLTVGRFEQAVDRAVIAVDPTAAAERRAEVVRGRRVAVFKQRNASDGIDGGATFWAEGPAESLTAVMACLDESARWCRDRGDARTLEQLRFDLFVTACTTGSLDVPRDLLAGTLAGLAPDGAAPAAAEVVTAGRPSLSTSTSR